MTVVGKSITVLVFLMSLLFLAFSVMVKSNHVNLKEIALEEQAKIGALETDVQVLRAEKIRLEDAIRHERAALRGALAALEVRAIQTEEVLKVKTASHEQSEQDRLNRIEELTRIEEELRGLTADIKKLEASIEQSKLSSESEFNRVVDVTAQIHEAVGLHRRLSERYEQLRLQIERIRSGMPASAAAPTEASRGSVR